MKAMQDGARNIGNPHEHAHARPVRDRCASVRTLALSATAVAALASTAAAVPASAQEPSDTIPPDSTIYSVEELVVRATRPMATVGGASAVDIRIDSLRIGPAPTLDEVLRSVPLVQIRRNSRGETHFALRGAQERQIAVLVDGVPLTLGWDHRSDLSVIPMLAANHIRLDRGLPSVLHGPNVLGGVVEVSVARGPFGIQDPDPLRIDVGADHVGAAAVGAASGRRVDLRDGVLILRGGAGFRDSPGFAPAAGTPTGPTDLRLNSDTRQADGFAALRYRADSGRWLSFSASGFRAARGVPPEDHVDDPRLWRYPYVGRLFAAASGGTGEVDTRWGSGDLETSIGVELGSTEIDQYETAAYERVAGMETGSTRTLSLRLLGEHTLGERADVQAAVTFADVYHDEVLEPTLTERYENEYRQRLWSVGGEGTWRLGPAGSAGGPFEAARLSGGLVLDGAYTPLTGGHEERPPITALGGRLGFSALVGGRVRVHTGLSRRARFPALRELYSAALGKFEPNPELGAETLLAAEAGGTVRLGDAGQLQAVGFHQRLTDAIVRTGSEVAKYRRVNRDEIRSTGVELMAGWDAGAFSVSGDLTLQRVRVLDPAVPDDDRRAEYQPGVAGGVDMALTLPLELHATARAEYTGRQWCVVPGVDEAGVALDARTGVDLGLRRRFSWRGAGPFDALDGTLSLDNATDTAIYDQCGLPRPGRTLSLDLRLR